ncbi:MAG: 4Fe-4S dicluster domain-containing protein [Bacteroidetes bacterium]|nr:4Fe-4S dicluster domain-containing protein [Bacteroidota bacterium]MCY4204492.1 4Fe-4S dicluster domain-containing protein [Bacteroidota bacterium]
MISLPVIDAPTRDLNRRLWRSRPHLDQDPDLIEMASEELIPGASDTPSGSNRRHFMQLLGASMAMAGLAACRRPVEYIMPFSDRPEELIPGVPLRYATAMNFRGIARPLLAKSYDGRPVKIEGNPEHPNASGSSGVFEQASLLQLYDPDRSKNILRTGSPASWNDFLTLCEQIQIGNRRIAVLASPDSSPTRNRLRTQLETQFPGATWIEYRSEGDDVETLGLQMIYGQALRPVYDFANADVIVSLDANFLGPHARNGDWNTRSFAQSRKLNGADDQMSRLYVAESTYTSTGTLADHRKRMRSNDISGLANQIASFLGIHSGETPDAFAASIAADLQNANGRCLILAGETQPAEVHALCALMNETLGAIGTTVTLLDTEVPMQIPQSQAFPELIEEMEAGQIDLLLMLGVNPVYDAPSSLNFPEAMSRVMETIHVGLHVDETARMSTWHLPLTHYLEAWGDGRSWDGTLTVAQPLIAPLYEDAKSEIEVLHTLVNGQHTKGYDLVRETWTPVLEDQNFESAWRRTLHDGYLQDTGFASVTPAASFDGQLATPDNRLELVFRLDPTILDGSFANNAWCQELPDPITKIVWDNVAVISPKTAEDYGLVCEYSKGRYYADVVTLAADGQEIELPIWILPGHADNTISVTMGYGREISTTRPERDTPFWDKDDETDIYARGTLATGVGTNVSKLRNLLAQPVLTGVELTATGRKWTIVTTQDHGILDTEARPLIRMATLDEYRQDPAFALQDEAPTPSSDMKTDFQDYPELWKNNHPAKSPAYRDSDYWQNQWGMVIDLNTCTGCNACIVACQAENNIQVVGKKEVGNGRELHWLRVDRYFLSEGDMDLDADPQIVMQPMPCQHCENAPCESVCPVAATVHSPDGTNQMIYNRCIGTRYCANNCPYKVRRYNFYNWSKTIPDTVQMAQNPNVSIRFRGVMEKCSFCIQRIRETQKRAGLEKRPLHRDEVATACQQACSAESITFGDLNDDQSKVSQAMRNPRGYKLLAELNVKPRVSYLARVRNPNQDLEPVG